MRTLIACCLVACGSESAADVAVDAAIDTAPAETALDATDAATDAATSLRRCPTEGKGAVVGDECFLLTPIESGLPAAGANANVDQFALRPTAGARGKLVVFFNGSGGSPLAGTRGSATANFYATARAAGLHVFAVSYRSDDSVGSLCKADDACFLPTRRTIVTGSFEAGAAPSLSSIAAHEGALVRLLAGLRTLAVRDPAGGWGAFVNDAGEKPADKLRWSLFIAAGHSQGGGHAALLGKAFAIDRVVALASPCDTTVSGPASWLDAVKSPYATSPATAFHGLGAAGDTICSGYPAIWGTLGLDASRRHADAIVCAGSGAHSAPLDCPENAPAWKKMLE
jgi:hypothetical protein